MQENLHGPLSSPPIGKVGLDTLVVTGVARGVAVVERNYLQIFKKKSLSYVECQI